jgi:endonuclease/exonuclease/phosphatase family metal-dependent hydrolase
MGTRVRVVAANLTTGNNQSYDPGEGARILEGIQGDVLLMQEFNEGTNTPADFESLAESICGMDCTHVRGPDAEIPNGIITRFPIIASGSWTDALVTNRTFLWAHLDVPGPIDLWAISVHLLTDDATNRQAEGTALASMINASIPPTDYVVLGGDFNTKARDEPVLAALDPIFVVDAPFPIDQLGNDATNSTRARPYDWVLATDALKARQIPVVLGQTTFVHGAVIDTRVYQPLSDIAPALMTDSGALNMQHMAIVKDFALE